MQQIYDFRSAISIKLQNNFIEIAFDMGVLQYICWFFQNTFS